MNRGLHVRWSESLVPDQFPQVLETSGQDLSFGDALESYGIEKHSCKKTYTEYYSFFYHGIRRVPRMYNGCLKTPCVQWETHRRCTHGHWYDAILWVLAVSNYFLFMNGTSQQEVTCAVTLLHEAAHDWWQAYMDRVHSMLPLDWDTISAMLLGHLRSKLRVK